LLVVAIGTLIAALALAAIGAIGILAGQARAAQAADLAALAAAEQVWFGETVACAEAGRIAEANGARLRECAADGLDAQVRVELPAPLPLVGAFAQARGLTVGATARAGPPDEL
jgi:secretion/DNA translocation related TadE-like protein